MKLPNGKREVRRVGFTTLLKQKLLDGFDTVNLLGEFEILVELTGKRDERLNEKSDVRIVSGRTWFDGANLSGRVREWGKKGYRLALVADRIAIMYRDGGGASRYTFVWLDSTSAKNWHLETRLAPTFNKYLAKLEESGAEYVSTKNQEWEDELIFEPRVGYSGALSEFNVLMLSAHVDVNPLDKKATLSMTDETKATMRQMNELLKEGFVVRDPYLSNTLSVLLERKR